MPHPHRRQALAALAVLLLAGVLPPAAPPAGAQANLLQPVDLGVDLVLPGSPRVNQSANVSAVITNHGAGNQSVLAFRVVFGFENETLPLAANSTVAYPNTPGNFHANESCALTPAEGLRPGCSVRVDFTWTPPLEHRGARNLSATVRVGAVYEDIHPADDVARVAGFVAHHDLALVLEPADERVKSVRPGDAAFYRLTLQNQGNVRDVVNLRLTSPEWGNATLTLSRTSLEPGTSARFLALLTAAEDPGTEPRQTTVTVNATSALAPALGLASRVLPQTRSADDAGASYGLDLEPPPEAFVATGGLTDLQVPLRNTGGSEDAVTVELVGSLAEGWSATLPEPWLGLAGPGGHVAQVPVRVVTNATLPSGASTVVGLRVTSLNGGATQVENLTFRTAAADLALMDFRVERAAVYQEDEVLLVADVRNLGIVTMPQPSRFQVSALAPGANASAAVTVGEVLFSGLAAGQERSLLLRWRPGNLSGPFDLRARLDPDDAIPEVLETNNDRTVPVVVRTAGLAVTAPPAREVRPGTTVSFATEATFTVRNLGNAPEEVRVQLSTEQGWTTHEAKLRLGPGEAGAVPFTLVVPEAPRTLEEPLRATASLVNRTATAATNTTALRLLDTEAPLLESLEAPDFVELGTSAEFRAVLRDAVGVRNATLLLRLPDATLRQHALVASSGDAWTTTVVLTQPGAVSFWLRATDLTPQNNTLDTSGSQAAFLVGVRSAPLIELLEPLNNSVVRSGTPLRLRLTDVHGLGEVSVREGGRTFLLEPPYALATAGLGGGPHLFEVVARNRFGNAATARFGVTLDDTPPRVQDGRVEPARPSPGQEVRVEVRTSQDARLATVQVSREGRLVEEVPAEVGLGLVTAKLVLAEAGRYTLGVRVEDAAGNAATLDLPVGVGVGLPGFEAEVVALAAALAMLATRRRREP